MLHIELLVFLQSINKLGFNFSSRLWFFRQFVNIESVLISLEVHLLMGQVHNKFILLVQIVGDWVVIDHLCETQNVGNDFGIVPNFSPSRDMAFLLVRSTPALIVRASDTILGLQKIIAVD
jgi:hypothetical protein